MTSLLMNKIILEQNLKKNESKVKTTLFYHMEVFCRSINLNSSPKETRGSSTDLKVTTKLYNTLPQESTAQ